MLTQSKPKESSARYRINSDEGELPTGLESSPHNIHKGHNGEIIHEEIIHEEEVDKIKLILKLYSKFYENRLSKIEYIIVLPKSVGHKELD